MAYRSESVRSTRSCGAERTVNDHGGVPTLRALSACTKASPWKTVPSRRPAGTRKTARRENVWPALRWPRRHTISAPLASGAPPSVAETKASR